MENLILAIFALGCGIVTLLGWLWLSAERDLTNTRREFDSCESQTRKLSEELSNLKQMLLQDEKRLSGAAYQDDDNTNQHGLRSDLAELRRKLDESQSKLSELIDAERAQEAVRARGDVEAAEIIRLDDRVVELEQELAKDEAKLRDLDLVCERLAEGERIRHALREEYARNQAQLEYGRQRSLGNGESAREMAFIEERFDDLLTMQTAFAEAQRRLHDALAAFAGRMDQSSKAVIETPTFELFSGSAAPAQPISTGSAPASGNAQQPSIHSGAEKQSGSIPRLRNLKAPKAG